MKDMAKIFVRTQIFPNKTFSEISTQIPRFLNKTEIAIQKYNHQDIIHTLPVVNTEDMSTDQTITTKQ